MQDERKAFRSVSEILELELGPSSSSSGMDLALHWNDNLNAQRSLSLPSHELPTNEPNVTYPTLIRGEESSLATWHPAQPSSSNLELHQQTMHTQAEDEHAQTCPMIDGTEPSLRLDWGLVEPNRTLSVHGKGINLNGSSPHNAGSSMSFLGETDNNGQSYLFDDQHLRLKRKASRGPVGESSSRYYSGQQGVMRGGQVQLGPVPMETISYNNPPEELCNQRSALSSREGPFSNTSLSESSERNTRLRTISTHRQDSPLPHYSWGPASTPFSTESNVTTNHFFPGYVPFNGTPSPSNVPEVNTTSQAPHLTSYPRCVSPFTATGTHHSMPSSSFSTELSAGRLSAPLEGMNSNTDLRSSLGRPISPSDDEVFGLALRMNRRNMNRSESQNILSSSQSGSDHMSPSDDQVFGLALRMNRRNINRSGSQNIASSSESGSDHSGVRFPPSANRTSSVPPSQRLTALIQHNFSATGSGSGSRNANILSAQPVDPSSSRQHNSLPLGGPHRQLSARLPMDGQGTGVPGMPLAIGSSGIGPDWSRLSTQLRTLILARRRGSVNLEDMINHSIFHGAADLNDRHRDMRLDVDNMSYEDLLALEERIGNVSTGLTEETISNNLKQRIYASFEMEATQKIEPCCICQEEYVEGEELGKLNCGHDFHTACIKQWLVIKNICPICKKTALDT